MEKKYYLPIGSASLAHYFGCACIKPSKYFDNKQEDLQSKFEDFLFVTTHFGTQQTDCCLELVFTKQEEDELIDIKNGFYLYEKPLPITRVRKVYFSNRDKKEQTITNINMSTAFVPEDIIGEVKPFDNPVMDDIKKPQDIEILHYNKQIKVFNSFLGGLALMRLAGEEYMNYSENYFATLSFFNTLIQRDLQNSKMIIDNRYRGVFTGENGFQRIIPYLNKIIDENDINNLAQEENQVIKRDKITKTIDLNTLDKWTYTIAVLNTYGVGGESKRKRIDNLILSNFKSDIKSGKSEGIALCYGINRGYSAFSNKYILGKIEKVVKYQLNSLLDYYTIESLYQYAFNNKRSDEFSYLDWCPKQTGSKKCKTDYSILDVIVTGKKKANVFSSEYMENLLSQFFQKDTAPLFRGLLENLREIIYNDTKDEIADDYVNQINLKQEEINKLKVKQKEFLNSQSTAHVKEERLQLEKSIEPIVEQQTTNFPKNGVKQIIEQYLEYKLRNKKSLEDEAKNRGINVKGKKVEEIIILLMTTSDSKFNI